MRTQNRRFRLIASVSVAGLLIAQMVPQPATAQGAPPPPPQVGVPAQQSGDPPERVGRLAQLSGAVSFHAQDDSQWNPATLNYPVTQGSAFWTEPNAQAVIEVSASRIAMAPGTELDIAALTGTAFQATEPQGEVYLNLRPAAPDETYAVQTPRGMVTFAVPGRYGVVAGDIQTPTVVTAIEGSAHVEGPGVSLDVGPGQAASISGSDTFQGQVGPAQRDAFLTAMLDSERPPQPQGIAPPQVVAEMPGGDDLAQYGSWAQTQDYGEVWYPPVAPDWVPYRDGSWAYVAPWGWTWVDSAPWGFAPFHYGRWAEIGGRWGWIPGGAVGGYRPVYAPALVTFVGVGAVVGVGMGAALAAGRIGWLPLGPREPFHPWYRASDRYFRQVNASHVSQLRHHQPRPRVQQLRQSPRRDGGADERDDCLATGGRRLPAGRSGAACAGAAGDRAAAAAPVACHHGRDPGGRPPVESAAAVAGHARRSARPDAPCHAGRHLGRSRGRGGGGPPGPAAAAQPWAADTPGHRRGGASVRCSAGFENAGRTGADRPAGDPARTGSRRTGRHLAPASPGQSWWRWPDAGDHHEPVAAVPYGARGDIPAGDAAGRCSRAAAGGGPSPPLAPACPPAATERGTTVPRCHAACGVPSHRRRS